MMEYDKYFYCRHLEALTRRPLRYNFGRGLVTGNRRIVFYQRLEECVLVELWVIFGLILLIWLSHMWAFGENLIQNGYQVMSYPLFKAYFHFYPRRRWFRVWEEGEVEDLGLNSGDENRSNDPHLDHSNGGNTSNNLHQSNRGFRRYRTIQLEVEFTHAEMDLLVEEIRIAYCNFIEALKDLVIAYVQYIRNAILDRVRLTWSHTFKPFIMSAAQYLWDGPIEDAVLAVLAPQQYVSVSVMGQYISQSAADMFFEPLAENVAHLREYGLLNELWRVFLLPYGVFIGQSMQSLGKAVEALAVSELMFDVGIDLREGGEVIDLIARRNLDQMSRRMEQQLRQRKRRKMAISLEPKQRREPLKELQMQQRIAQEALEDARKMKISAAEGNRGIDSLSRKLEQAMQDTERALEESKNVATAYQALLNDLDRAEARANLEEKQPATKSQERHAERPSERNEPRNSTDRERARHRRGNSNLGDANDKQPHTISASNGFPMMRKVLRSLEASLMLDAGVKIGERGHGRLHSAIDNMVIGEGVPGFDPHENVTPEAYYTDRSHLKHSGEHIHYDGEADIHYDGEADIQYDGEADIQYDGEDIQYDGVDIQHVGEDTQHGREDIQYDGEDIQFDGEDIQHVGEDIQHGGEDIYHGRKDIQHGGEDIQNGGEDIQPGGEDFQHIGDWINYTELAEDRYDGYRDGRNGHDGL